MENIETQQLQALIEDVASPFQERQILTDQSKNQEQQFSLHPLRWVLQIFYTTGLISDAFLMIGFSPVASVIADAFECKKILVDAQCLLFLIIFVPGNFLVIFALNKYGLKICLQIGGSLSILGCWLRLLVQISGNFYLMIPGTIICALAQVFFLNCGSRLATVWFGDKERALATAVGSLSIPMGSIMGFIVPALFFEGEGDKKEIFYKYVLYQNIIVTVMSLPILFVARHRPAQPPSISSMREEPKMNLGKELRIILRNKSYLLLSCTFIFMHGLYTTFGAVVSSITKPYGYKPIDNSIFGVVFTIFGLIGSVFFGIILDKYAKYKLITNIMSIGASISLSLMLWTLPTSNVLLHSANLAFAGFFLTPMIPIGYAFSVELTFPVPESVANGMMNMICQIYGTIMGAFASYICYQNEENGPLIVIGIFVITCLISVICTFCIEEELKRLKPKIEIKSDDSSDKIESTTATMISHKQVEDPIISI